MALMRTLLAMAATPFGLLLAIPVILLGLPFWLVAILTRLPSALWYRLRPQAVPWQQLIEFEPTVGWKPKPNLNTFGNADGIFRLTTDAQGWRGQLSIAQSDLVVFGDSFAFGYGMHDRGFFARLNPVLRIKTIGVNGYNMVQALLWMQRLSAQLSDKVVVWFIYYGNDLYENLQPNLDHYRMPFVRTANGNERWEIVTSHVSSAPWSITPKRQYYQRLAEICSPTFLAERVYSACEFLIGQGQQLCQQSGAQLVVMSVPDVAQLDSQRRHELVALSPNPSTFDPDLPDKKIAEFCRKLDIPFVALKNHLTEVDYKSHDVHWNERGHQRVAEVLRDVHDEYVQLAHVRTK